MALVYFACLSVFLGLHMALCADDNSGCQQVTTAVERNISNWIFNKRAKVLHNLQRNRRASLVDYLQQCGVSVWIASEFVFKLMAYDASEYDWKWIMALVQTVFFHAKITKRQGINAIKRFSKLNQLTSYFVFSSSISIVIIISIISSIIVVFTWV